MMKLLVIFGLFALTAAYTIPQEYEPLEDDLEEQDRFVRSVGQDDEQEYYLVPVAYFREKRSLQPGAPTFPQNDPNKGNNAGVDLTRQGQDTVASINAQHSADRFEVGGEWSKVVRGPNKAKPNWNVHGAYKW